VDTLAAIDDVVLAKPVAGGCPLDLPAELAWACPFVQTLTMRLAAALRGGKVKSSARYVASGNYVGGNVFLETSEGERCLWVWSTPPGWPYHTGDGEMSLWLAEQTDHGSWPPDLRERARRAGFTVTQPKTPGIGPRRGWPLGELRRMGEQAAADALVAYATDVVEGR
jgi:hypothetical protein